MKIKYEDIEFAFDVVSSAPEYENSAILSKDTGEVYFISESGDSDELPDDVDESDEYLAIPHKNELDLGTRLVRDFVAERLPDCYDEVDRMFHSRGAYSRFKDFLHSKGLLEQWFEYEEKRSQAALRQWCAENGLDVSG